MAQFPQDNLPGYAYEAIIGAISTGIGWLLGRGRAKAETQTLEITNAMQASELWRTTAQELRKIIEKQNEDISALNTRINELYSEQIKLKAEIETVNYENSRLRGLLEKFSKDITSL